jgi:8-oxo-dGTP diphosphatase
VSEEPIAVTAAVIVADGRVLLMRRPPGDRLAGLWELPGGKVEPGESPEECLARELAEECSLTVTVGRFFAESVYRYPHAHIKLLAFWVDTWTGELELRAHDDHRWVRPLEAEELTLAPADIPILERLRDELS